MDDAERIRKRLPDYFKAIEMPWHFAVSYLAKFVDDDEEPLGAPLGGHHRNLFHVARSLNIENHALRRDLEAATTDAKYWRESSEKDNVKRQEAEEQNAALNAKLVEVEKERAAAQIRHMDVMAETGPRIAALEQEIAEARERAIAHTKAAGESAAVLIRERDEAKKDAGDWKRDSLMWSSAWERELDGFYVHKTHRIDAAVVSTRKVVERVRTAEASKAKMAEVIEAAETEPGSGEYAPDFLRLCAMSLDLAGDKLGARRMDAYANNLEAKRDAWLGMARPKTH